MPQFKYWAWFFLSFKGRVQRLPFLFGELPVIFLVSLVLVNEDKMQALNMYSIFLVGFVLLLAWPHLALTTKRLHDINLSGWFFLIYFIPFVSVGFFLVLLLKGSVEPNKYGTASPKKQKT